MALFAGSAAQATNDSLLQWRQLWQQQDATNKQYDLAQQQMTFQAQQQKDAQAFQERLAKAQEAFQLGVLDRNELFEVSKIALDQMANMTPEQQWAQVEALQGLGSPLLSVAQNSVRTSLFDNFSDAVNLVDSVFTAPIGTAFNPAFVGLAADAVIARSGMQGEEAEAFRNQLDEALAARGGDAEEWNALQWDSARTSLSQARANVDQTVAQTTQIDAQTAQIFQNTQFDADKHGFIVDSLELQNRLLTLEGNQLELVNGNLPAQFSAELRNLEARTRELDNGAELFNRTLEHQVRTFAAQTGIAEEELRHTLATGLTRDAIVQGDLDYLRATIDYVGAQEAESIARAEGLNVSTDAARLDMTNTRVAMVTQLVELGRGDLLAQVGGELFAGLGIPEDAQGELLASLRETADSRLSSAEKIEKANVQVALAEARHATWQAATAEEQRRFDNDIATQRLALEQQGMALEEQRLQGYLNSLNAPAPGSVSIPTSDIHNAVKNGIGISVGDLNSATSNYNGWVQADQTMMGMVAANPDGTFEVRDREGLAALAQQYGIDASLMDPQETARALQTLITVERNTTRSRAEADTLAYARAFIQESGRIPTAGELGFETGDPIYTAAIQRIPGLTLLPDASDAVTLDLENLAATLSPSIGEDGILFGGASAVYEDLLATHGETALEAAGIFDASAVLPILQRASAEYQQDFNLATAAAESLGAITGQTWNLENADERMNLEQTMASYENTAETFIGMLDELPTRTQDFFNGFVGGWQPSHEEAQYVLNVSRTLGIPLAGLLERGLVNQAGNITDRAGFRQLLLSFQGTLADQRIAVQSIDGLLRER